MIIKERLTTLKWYGLLAHWPELTPEQLQWIETWMDWEEREKQRRSLERRMQEAKIGRFKLLADFDWRWPSAIDQAAIHELMTLSFLNEPLNAILIGPNGVGKSMIVQNIAHQAALQGYRVLFTTASEMLNELAAQDSDTTLRRRLHRYAQPALLVIDEVGYLSYGMRHADLLFEVINRRYEKKATIITTNKPLSEWGSVFPNASCVVSLVDRLVHHAEVISIEGESYRLKEAKEKAARRQQRRTTKREEAKNKKIK